MDQPSSVGIGSRVRTLRRARGLKQQDLAFGEISVSYVSLIESGKRAPSEAVLATLAERLGCSTEYLRSGKDDTRTADLKMKISFADMAMRNGSNGEALQAYSEVLASAPFLDDASQRRARIGQAHALEKLGSLEAALRLMNNILEDPELPPGSSEWTQLVVAICRCYRNAGDFTMSVEVGERALKELSALGLEATDDHIQLGATLVSAYRSRGDLTRAHMLAERLIKEADRSGSPVARGSIYWNAAVVASSRGASREALALAERALALMSETDSVRHIAMLRGLYGQLLMTRGAEGDIDRAAQLLNQAQEQLVDTGTAVEQALGELHLAELNLHLHDFRATQEHASRAIGLLRNEPRPETALARTVMAEAQFRSAEPERAGETLTAATHQLRQVPPSLGTAWTWRRVAELWQELGQPDQALSAYDRALTDAGVAPALRSVKSGAFAR